MNDITIGFVGFGLIGGSIARALREHFPTCRLIAYNYNKTKQNENLLLAKKDGTIHHIYTDFSEGFPQCDIIFLCAPVLTNIAYLDALKQVIKPSCILTDVGSVKGNIYTAIQAHDLEEHFIGGHPMAGSEKTGYANSSSHLLENAFYILTPTPKTPPAMLEKMSHLVKCIGAIPVVLAPKEHDDITAAISHVPHIIASNLVNMVREQDDAEEKMHALAAGGFKDITRIASSSPIMWQNICLTNTESIIKFLEIFQKSITETITALQENNQDFLLHNFETAKEYRDTLPQKNIGLLEKVFEVYVDIIDETGAIATISTILASNHISIKNIGILHNREFEQGVLHIEFYDDVSVENAITLLEQYHYTIYTR